MILLSSNKSIGLSPFFLNLKIFNTEVGADDGHPRRSWLRNRRAMQERLMRFGKVYKKKKSGKIISIVDEFATFFGVKNREYNEKSIR